MTNAPPACSCCLHQGVESEGGLGPPCLAITGPGLLSSRGIMMYIMHRLGHPQSMHARVVIGRACARAHRARGRPGLACSPARPAQARRTPSSAPACGGGCSGAWAPATLAAWQACCRSGGRAAQAPPPLLQLLLLMRMSGRVRCEWCSTPIQVYITGNSRLLYVCSTGCRHQSPGAAAACMCCGVLSRSCQACST